MAQNILNTFSCNKTLTGATVSSAVESFQTFYCPWEFFKNICTHKKSEISLREKIFSNYLLSTKYLSANIFLFFASGLLVITSFMFYQTLYFYVQGKKI